MSLPLLARAVASPWVGVAGCAVVAALSAAAAANLWITEREREATRSRLAGRRRQSAEHAPARVEVFEARADVTGWRRHLAGVLARVLPPMMRGPAAAERMARAGYFAPEAPLYFAAARLAVPVLLPALMKLLDPYATPLMLAIGFCAGCVAPVAVLDHVTGRRRRALQLAIPDALDLLVVCLEAGVGIDAALARVARELEGAHPALADELGNVTRRTAAGLPREEALQALVTRTQLEIVRAIVTTIVQAERLGTSLAGVLRVHGDGLREQRRQLAEKRAAEASVKMVFPLVVFLLPAFFAIVLGPAVLSMLSVARGP